MTDYHKVRLKITKGPDIEFEGFVVHEYSTQNASESKRRWTELRLWQTRGGAWIAEQCGVSMEGGERDLREALVIDPPKLNILELGQPERSEALPIVPAEAAMEVMDFWGWTSAAKAFAKQAGWDVTRRVD